MRIQHNKQTRMTWVYIPTRIVRLLELKKEDEVEFIIDENEDKIEFKKTVNYPV